MRELMLFMALVCSTLQYFAMVILIPIMCSLHYTSLTSVEIGILIIAATAGELASHRYTEPFIDKFGIKWSLQLGFIL